MSPSRSLSSLRRFRRLVHFAGDEGGVDTIAESRVSRVGDDGRWTEAFPALDLDADSEVSTEVWSGGAFVHAAVGASLFPYDLNFFGIYQLDLDNTLLETVADTSGGFEVLCPADDAACGARYGYVSVRDGADEFVLRWIAGPSFGVAVTRSNALGNASAGARVSVDGEGLDEPRTAVSRPGMLGRLPGWELPLNDIHPDGLPLGSVYQITIDGETREIVIPRLNWNVDTRSNTVSGFTDLALRAIFVVAYSNGDESRPPAGIGSAVIGAQPDTFSVGEHLRLSRTLDAHATLKRTRAPRRASCLRCPLALRPHGRAATRRRADRRRSA